MENNLLVIDDEQEILKSLYRQFRKDYKVSLANNAEEALQILEEVEIQVILCDQRMPQMTGVEFFARIKTKYPDAIRLILTGYTDIEDIIKAINDGNIYHYLKKPWDPIELKMVLDEAFEKYNLIVQNRQLLNELQSSNTILEKKVEERTFQLGKANNELRLRNDQLQAFNKEYQQINEELNTVKEIIEESEAQFRLVFENSTDAILWVDIETRTIIKGNNAVNQLFDCRKEELIGKELFNLFPVENRITKSQLSLCPINLEEAENIECEITTKKEQIKTVEISSTRINIGDKKINQLIIKDISFRKQTEQTIQKQNAELKELNATKDKFFSIIAHDLKTPFHSILGFSALLMKNIINYNSEKILTFAVSINQSAKETLKLLENILDWARLQRGLMVATLQKTNLKTLILEVTSLSSEIAKSKNIHLQNSVVTDIFANCDGDMTKTILRNLISNAMKFTHAEGIISIYATETDSQIAIHIKDTGIGIAAHIFANLFTIEKGSTSHGTAGESGTGLGLVLCKDLTEKQGGKIWAESEVGVGSILHFTLAKWEE